MIHSELFAQSKAIRENYEHNRTDAEDRIVERSDENDIYTCPKHLKRYHDDFLTLKLNRQTIHLAINRGIDFRQYKKEEEKVCTHVPDCFF